MNQSIGCAAAWAAPLLAIVEESAVKQTHKLKPQVCLLWLPDYGAYLKGMDLSSGRFTVTRSPERAMRLGDDMAEAAGQSLVETTGVRVALRPYNQTH